jgi:hypothetical protein
MFGFGFWVKTFVGDQYVLKCPQMVICVKSHFMLDDLFVSFQHY